MKRNVKAARIESRGRLLRQTEKRFASRRRWQSYSEAAQDIGYDARRWGFYLRFLYSVLIGIQFFYATFCSGQSLMETIVLEDGRYHGAMSGITQWLAALVCSTTCSIGEMVQPLRLLSGLASLALSSAFIWWNPQWRLTTKQTQHKVLGLGSWYFSQVLCLMVQAGLFYCDWATPIMQSYPVGMVVLHLLSLFSVAYLWPRTSQRVKVQANKLYSVPDRAQLLYRRPSNELLPRGMNKLAEALDSITNTSTTPSTPTTTLKDNITSTPSDYPENVFIPLKRPAPIAVETWKFTNAPKPLETLSLDDPPPVYSEEMDWEPNCNTMSKHRAFQPMPPTRDATFNGAPTGPNAPRFWFKVPQMPMTPARKLRNPPQPYLQAPLVETKENFFKSMTERGPMDTKRFGRVANRPEYPMAQPKFFPPGSMEDQTGLADLLSSSWKIGDDEEDNVNSIGGMVSKEGGKATQMFKSLVEVLQYIISVIIAIALSAGLWKFLAVVALSSSFYIVVGALVAAMLVNSAIILDTTLTIARRRATWASFLKLAFATTETAVAAHIMSIFADDGEKIGFEERVKGALVLVAALVSCTSKYRKWR